MEKFYDDRTNWMPTWNGEEAALQVDYIRVYQYVGDGGRPFLLCDHKIQNLSFKYDLNSDCELLFIIPGNLYQFVDNMRL